MHPLCLKEIKGRYRIILMGTSVIALDKDKRPLDLGGYTIYELARNRLNYVKIISYGQTRKTLCV